MLLAATETSANVQKTTLDTFPYGMLRFQACLCCSVFVRLVQSWAVQKRLNRSRCRFDVDSCGPHKEPCLNEVHISYVRPSVCLSVCIMHLAQRQCVLRLLLLQNSNRKAYVGNGTRHSICFEKIILLYLGIRKLTLLLDFTFSSFQHLL